MHLRHLLLPAALVAASASAHAQTLALNPVADTYVFFGASQDTNFGTADHVYLFANATIRETFGYFRFDLSALPADTAISDASLTFFRATAARNDAITTGRFGVFGLNDVAGNTAQDWSETTLTFNNRGAEWTAVNTFDTATRLTNLDGTLGNEVINTTATPNFASVSGTGLVDFLTTRRAAGGLTTFIVDQTGTDAGRGYGLGTRENVDPSLIPVLSVTLTAIPEPSTYAALLGAGTLGLVVWRRRRAHR